MTVKLKCGSFKSEDMGGYHEIECNYVMEEDLKVDGKKQSLSKVLIIEGINKLTNKELIDVLKESDFDAEDIVDVDWSW